jgi:hypothetical protein
MVGEGHLTHTEKGFTLTGCDGKLNYEQKPLSSYGLYSDYFWYEIGDPFLIYKDGEFYRLRKAWETGIITGAFLSEVNDRYKAANPGFYDYNH